MRRRIKRDFVQRRLCRKTRTHVVVQREDCPDALADGLKWTTICEEHGGVVSHMTQKAALEWAPHPDEWCPFCQEREGECD